STGIDGTFSLTGVPEGTHALRAARIGYGPQQQDVTVTAGGTVTVTFALQPQAALLEEVVVTGYGTQRREAITGSVATVDGDVANVGVLSNVNNMIQGRVAGLNIIQNNGEPGAGAQILVRGGTSIRASNEPLYVIDGVPIENAETELRGIGIGGAPALPRSPLNLLNPADIASVTVLKDAAAAAIYGSRAANGVILIETRKGTRGGAATMEYDGYVAMATPARRLEVLNGDEYRDFVKREVRAGRLNVDTTLLGTANTNWEDAVTRTAVTHNHNLSFTGGSEATQYRASLNLLDQQGVVIANGLERIQGRLNATHQTLDDRLRLTLNVTASHVENDYLPFETTGGFEGGVFVNMVNFNPTRPVTVTDPSTGEVRYYEIGPGSQSTRNPVALAEQIADFGRTTRVLGNTSAEVDLLPGLTGQINIGVDRTNGLRQIYMPKTSPVGAQWNGRAAQFERENTTKTFQSYLTYNRQFAAQSVDIVGGYEFSEFTTADFGAEARDFLTDAFSFDNLGAGNALVRPFSGRSEKRVVSFFGRANYGLNDKYFLTGVLRYDGSSVFGEGNKWGVFPAISASWRMSQESFMQGRPFGLSDLRLRAGWGVTGNPAIPAYSSLPTFEPGTGFSYPWGDQPVTGVGPTRNPNPDLKWERTSQFNVALDYGFLDNRVSGTIEYYLKNTSDLLLEVLVPPPAAVSRRFENIGKVRNQGVEIALDAVPVSRPGLRWRAGLVFEANRNKVLDLGGESFIPTAGISGQGQSDQQAQRIIPGQPLGTFYGRVFSRVASETMVVGTDTLWKPGQELFRCRTPSATCVNGETRFATGDDFAIIGNANPDFTLSLHSQVTWGRFNFSALIRSVVGQDVFNNTALVYATKGNAKQDKNFLRSALNDPTGIDEPAIYSSRWIEDGSFVRLQNVTVEYDLDLPILRAPGRTTRLYVSGDNLLLITGYSGLDPEVHADAGLASRGIDYLSYPRARTVTAGIRVTF
ncbi:MAG TPA: TonB-dependent receptor, partial [Gemmatimonadales bacterium]|nr:TonB-dependent receptor [Gemmatimonadales bacterium]